MNTQKQVKPYKIADLSECTQYSPLLHGKRQVIFFFPLF